MKWTGHSDFTAMKPYVAIVDELKKANMAKYADLFEKEKILPIEKKVVFLQIDRSKKQSGTCTHFVPTFDK